MSTLASELGPDEVKSVCPYCGVGCGLVLRAAEGRLTGLRPDPDHPISLGTLCPKGATAHQFVHHADRIVRPLVRQEGRLVETGWDKAYERVAAGLERIREQHGPGALGLVSSSRATIEDNFVAQKFARAVLRTNNIDNCFRICHSATAIGLKESLGSGAMTNSIPEFLEPGPGAILLVGSNTPHSHPIIWNLWIRKAVRRGARLVVVDPRRTRAAALADMHLAARPGTEIALFSAMAYHIVESGLHDVSFIARRCRNFAGFWAAARHYTPERVDELCGVPAAEIRRAAEIYASADRGSIVYGLGVTEHRSGVAAVQSLANLALITGNVGRLSTGINALRGQNDVQGATDMCAPEWLPGYQGWEDSAAVSAFEREWEVALPRPVGDPMFFSQMWERALSGELKGLIVVGSDPALSEGNTRKVERALKALELLVVCEVLPSRTVEFADVVLPAASYAEKTGTFVNTDRRVQLVRGAIEPVGESRPDWSILSGLAERMGYGGLRYSGPEEIFEEIRRLVPLYAGITYSRLESGGLQWPCPTEEHPGTPFLHAEGFKWGRALLKAVDYEPPEEEPDDEYPFLLTTGRTYMQYNAGNMTARTKTGALEPENFVQLSPTDARALDISKGDRVRVSTRRGALEVSAAVAPVTEGVIWMPFHYPDAPTNLLTNDAIDWRCGITELKVCAARVEKCNAVAPASYPDVEGVTDAT